MGTEGTGGIIWLAAAGVLGFLISAVFSDGLKLSRRKFLLAYLPLAAIFLVAFFWFGQIDWKLFFENWYWGGLAGVAVSIILVTNVREQPKSRATQGTAFYLDLVWLGLSYGLIDGLFLNVFPVLAIRQAFGDHFGTASFSSTLALAALGLVASLIIALTYHLGYQEYRNASVWKVLLGNGVITLAYLVSGSPLAAVLSHVVMHVAAVIQGPETTLQLPPHRIEQADLSA